MKKRLISAFLALALTVCLSACGTAAPAKQDVPLRSYTDDCGREAELPEKITAIVPSGTLSQIVLFALAPDLLVGLAEKWSDAAEGFIAEKYYDLPCFGKLYGSAALNIEELALAAPQLIIDVGEAKNSAAEDMDTLQAQTGIPSVHIEASLGSMAQAYRELGALLGREAQAEKLAQFCERVYDRTLSVMAQVGEHRVGALYVQGEDGLNVLAKGSYHAEMIDLLTDNLAVVENPAAQGTGNAVTMEQIALWDPEFILFAPDSGYDTAAQDATWRELRAVSSGSYVRVPEGPYNWMGSPPSVQRYLGLIWLPVVLYPEYCDYDVKAEIMEYYELFYGCTLTEAQYAALTAGAFRNEAAGE